MNCRQCGTTLHTGATTCPRCGGPILWGPGVDQRRAPNQPGVSSNGRKILNQVKQTLANNKWTQEETQKIIDAARDEAQKIIQNAVKENDKLEKQISEARRVLTELKAEKSEVRLELKQLQSEVFVEAANLEEYESITSAECQSKLKLLEIKEKSLIKDGKAVNSLNSEMISKKVMNSNMKQILRCFESESSAIIWTVSTKNIDTVRNKLGKCFETLNKLFATAGVSLSPSLLEIKFEELNLIYAYRIKVEEEKEIRRQERAQILEERKVLREIEAAKLRIEKEETQFKNEINRLTANVNISNDNIQIQTYNAKIKELEEKLSLLQKDKENVLEREQNTRAGYVYVISNIGSFGVNENIYKIGVTRRENPEERIRELSSASVPFPFDIHAIVFSHDAPALENTLHQTFRDYQVNKVNNRKEFFKIDLGKIKEVIYANHNATVNFMEMPKAEEYRETMRIGGGQPSIEQIPSAALETAAAQDVSKVAPDPSDIEVFQRVQEIFEIEGIDSAGLSHTTKPNDFSIHLGSPDGLILCYNSSDNSLRLPFSTEEVAKRIGNILRYEADGDSTRVFITEPQDTYKLAKLITRRVKELEP